MRLILCVTTLWIAACVATQATAQTPVPLGKGSYASALPPELENVAKIERQKLNLVEEKDEAISTNQWWTQLQFNQFAKSLWAFPMKVDTSKGLCQLRSCHQAVSLPAYVRCLGGTLLGRWHIIAGRE